MKMNHLNLSLGTCLNEVVMAVTKTHLNVGGKGCNRCLDANISPETVKKEEIK